MTLTTFLEGDVKSQSVEMKVGILGTRNPEGFPHLTMISTLQACSPTELSWGQFTEGLSKEYIRQDPRAAFLVMTLDKNIWRGKATWSRIAKGGPEYEMYNNLPMFRYNAYFGVHTVYYMDLVEHRGMQELPMGQVVGAALRTVLARALSRKRDDLQVLNQWTRGLFNKLDNLKFVGYIDSDGYPFIIPVIQAQARDSEYVIFSTSAYKDELETIPVGCTVAIFGMSFDMEDVLLRGEFQGVKNVCGSRCGIVRVNWVYNSMPPTPQQIYPLPELEPVRTF